MSLEEHLGKMQAQPWDQQEKAYSTLIKVLQNIASNPGEAKFRSIKSSSGALQKILSLTGGEGVMLAAGFALQGEVYALNGDDLSACQSVLAAVEAHANKAKLAELRRQRDEGIEEAKEQSKCCGNKAMAREDLLTDEMKEQLERDRKELEASRSVNPVKSSKAKLNSFGMNGMKTAQDVVDNSGG
jgi:hypothetical protein